METSSTPQLIEYGIQSETSDVRVHVCPKARRVYVYPTREGRRAIESGLWKKVLAFQSGVEGATAEGYPVPPFSVQRCVGLEIAPDEWKTIDIRESDGPSVKGEKAVRLVKKMLEEGRIPLPYAVGEANVVLAKALQIQGWDIVADWTPGRIHIQVKCDYPGGIGGTGNLYLQTAERNPKGNI